MPKKRFGTGGPDTSPSPHPVSASTVATTRPADALIALQPTGTTVSFAALIVAAPEISVVIPTRFRETRLAFALDALAAQTLAPGRFEVIVVRAADATTGLLT